MSASASVRATVAGFAVLTGVAVAQAPGGDVEHQPEVRQVSGTIYEIGRIRIDTAQQRFELPGRVLRRDPPLEYLAVARGGAKGYESLLELEATAFEFNLACILIGLDAERSHLPQYQFHADPVDGQRVAIEFEWTSDGQSRSASAAESLQAGGESVSDNEWVYTGSTSFNGQYLAHISGTLIGFVHDPSSVIEHARGLGIGNYGLIGGNVSLLPPEGTDIRLVVKLLDD